MAQKFNFLTDMNPPLSVGMMWPMKSSALMAIREICPFGSPIRGTVEGGVSQRCMFFWQADGVCSNGDVAFQLLTPAEREERNKPKQTYDDCD